jgi:hypothetical protein
LGELSDDKFNRFLHPTKFFCAKINIAKPAKTRHGCGFYGIDQYWFQNVNSCYTLKINTSLCFMRCAETLTSRGFHQLSVFVRTAND